MLRTETRPDGLQIVRTPDTAGRLSTVQIPGGMLQYNYYPPSTPSGAGKASDILGPYGTNLHFTYDGSLATSTAWSGDVTGSVAWTYNSDFNKILEVATGATGSAQAAFGYDTDQLLTCASPTTCNPPGSDALRITRSTQNSLINSITLGNTTETYTYNTVGELATQVSTFSSSPLLNLTYHGAGAAARDALGRIVQKTEVISGATNVFAYTYDHLRRLTDVTVNGTLEEHFEYDANGNRTLGYNHGAGTTYTGTYDWNVTEQVIDRRQVALQLAKKRMRVEGAAEIAAGLATGYLEQGLLADALVAASMSLRLGPTAADFCWCAIDVLFDERLLRSLCLVELNERVNASG